MVARFARVKPDTTVARRIGIHRATSLRQIRDNYSGIAQNCAVSVEPARAVVEELGFTAWETRSK